MVAILSAVFCSPKQNESKQRTCKFSLHPKCSVCPIQQRFDASIVRNAQVLRREPFARRRTPLPQDDSGLVRFPSTCTLILILPLAITTNLYIWSANRLKELGIQLTG
jgi:hypothetical protein